MSTPIPTPFTPALDPLLREYGPVGACVYGRVWSYAQMADGVCKASQETIAAQINVTRKTVWRWVNILCADGYLVDLTPTLKNKPHEYRITNKPVTVHKMYCEGNTQPTVYESPSDCVLKSPEEILHKIPEEIQDQDHKNVANATRPALVPFKVVQETIEKAQGTQGGPQAVVRRMIQCLYPGRDPPNFGYIAKTASRMGGYVILADQLWHCNTMNVKGDPVAYAYESWKRGNKNGKSNSARKGRDTACRGEHEDAIGWIEDDAEFNKDPLSDLRRRAIPVQAG